MKARKENKVYDVDKVTKDRYVKEGFDIYDDDGKLIENGKNKTVPYEKYEELEKALEEAKKVPNNAKTLRIENEQLKAEKEELEKALEEANAKVKELSETNE